MLLLFSHDYLDFTLGKDDMNLIKLIAIYQTNPSEHFYRCIEAVKKKDSTIVDMYDISVISEYDHGIRTMN